LLNSYLEICFVDDGKKNRIEQWKKKEGKGERKKSKRKKNSPDVMTGSKKKTSLVQVWLTQRLNFFCPMFARRHQRRRKIDIKTELRTLSSDRNIKSVKLFSKVQVAKPGNYHAKRPHDKSLSISIG